MISETVLAELNELVASGEMEGMPGIVDSLPVIADAAEASSFSNLSQIMTQLQGPTARGLAGDISISGTAAANGIAVITGDARFAAGMVEVGLENLVRILIR